MDDQPEEVEKIRVSVTLTQPYIDALDRLVSEGIYLSRDEAVLEGLRLIFSRCGLDPFRLLGIPEAVEVLIDLGERSGDLENLKRAARYVVGGDEVFLRTAARRLKYEYLLWRIVAKGDVGKAPGEVIYGAGISWDTSFRIVETGPEGEVQITPKTAVTSKYIELGGGRRE